jgi:hypothetical protein
MPLPTIFGVLVAATGGELDGNFAALGALTTIPCTAAGSNAITLTPASNTPTVSAYAQLQGYSGIAASSNTGATTAAVGSLPSLGVYKDGLSGPVALTGGEIVAGNFFVLTYDAALNAGAGGFHLAVNLPLTYTPANANGSNASGTWPITLPGSVASVSSTTVATITAAQLTGGGTGNAIVLRSGSLSGSTIDVTAPASSIVAALSGAKIGTMFKTRLLNSTGQTVTLSGGTSVSVLGVSTTATGITHDFWGIVNAVSVASVTLYG